MHSDLRETGRLQLPPGNVADAEDFDLLLFLEDTEYHTINMRLVAVKQVPQLVLLARYRAAVRLPFRAENGLFNPQVPMPSRKRIL